MIVQCQNCQAKFRIADDKVPPKGVKVRCTRCQTTFVVRRDSDTDAPFATESTREVRAGPVPDDAHPVDFEADIPTNPGVWEPGVAATRAPAGSPQELATDATDPFAAPPASASGATVADFSVGAGAATVAGATDDPFSVAGAEPDFRVTAAPAPDPPSPTDPANDGFDRSAFAMPAGESAGGTGLLGDLPPASAAVTQPRADLAAMPTAIGRLRPAEHVGEGPEIDAERTTGRRPPRPRRSAVAAIVNALVLLLASVAALLSVAVYANEGTLDLSEITPHRVLEAIAGRSGRAGLVPVDVTNGLYDTRHGRPVFYVRGEVQHRGGAAAGPVRVRAELRTPDGLVRHAEARAGAAPTPEQIHGIAEADDLDALVRELSRSAPPLEPGRALPFVMLFYDYPDDLSEIRLQLRAELDASAPGTPRPGG